MLEPSLTLISYIVLNVWMNACMHENEEREGKIWPQGGSSGGGRIEPSITTQSKYCGSSRNPPFITSLSGSSLFTPWSNNRIWLDEVIDLGSRTIGLGTNTSSGKSNLSSTVGCWLVANITYLVSYFHTYFRIKACIVLIICLIICRPNP